MIFLLLVRDTIDATHSPVFHQMEGLHVFDQATLDKVPLFSFSPPLLLPLLFSFPSFSLLMMVSARLAMRRRRSPLS